MTIKPRTSGPSYSTDATAHNVSGFLAQRAALPSSEARPAVDTPTRPFADLYPSLYGPEAMPAARPSLLYVLARLAAWFGSRRPAMAVVPFALAAILGAHPAFAALQLDGEGRGAAVTADESYARALDQAQSEISGSCSASVINERLISAVTVHYTDEFVTEIRVRAICA